MNPIESLMNNDPTDFRDNVQDMLMQKLSDRLDLERVNVASNMFGDPDIEVSDEDDFEDDEYNTSDENDDDLDFEEDEDDEDDEEIDD